MRIIDSVISSLSCKKHENLHGDALFLLYLAGSNIYVYVKKITPAFLPHNNDITRIQIPNIPAFENVIRSAHPFFAIGYDSVNNVFAVWNPETVKSRLNKKSNISLYSTLSGQQEVAKTQKAIHYVSKQLQDAMIIPPSELQVVIEHYSSFFNIKEIDSKTDLSRIEETQDWESQYVNENGKLTRIANPKLLLLLKPCFDSPYPTFVQAYNIIEDFYGKDRFPAMQFKDWEYLLTHIDWNNRINNTKTQNSQCPKPKIRNAWSEDEMILALRLYYLLPFSKFNKDNHEVKQLASFINRTPSSVAMRLCNYEYVRTGKGLRGGEKLCKPLIDKYENNRDQLEFDAQKSSKRISTQKKITFDNSLPSDRNAILRNFWKGFIEFNKTHKGLYAHSKPVPHNWIGKGGLGIRGANLNIVLNNNDCRTEIYINSGSKEENKRIFDYYLQYKEEINEIIPELAWQRLDEKTVCRIYTGIQISFKDISKQEEIYLFFISTTQKMMTAFSKYSSNYKGEEKRDLKYYKKQIANINIHKNRTAILKDAMLLSTIDYVLWYSRNYSKTNILPLLANWEGLFLNIVKEQVGDIGRMSTMFSTPFIQLNAESFWRIIPYDKEHKDAGRAMKTFNNLQETYEGVKIDQEFLSIVLDTSQRNELRKYIISRIRKHM